MKRPDLPAQSRTNSSPSDIRVKASSKVEAVLCSMYLDLLGSRNSPIIEHRRSWHLKTHAHSDPVRLEESGPALAACDAAVKAASMAHAAASLFLKRKIAEAVQQF